MQLNKAAPRAFAAVMMELAPTYQARVHRQHVAECLDLLIKANAPQSIALLIDTAIEQRRAADRLEAQAPKH